MKITKTTLILIAIFLVAFLLRLISSAYVDIGSDEMIYSLIPYNIISAERLSTVEQAPLYFYLVDLGYKLTGGITLISTRLPSTIFGAAAAIILFLITLHVTKNKKASFLAALFFAFSGYALRFSQEMDMTAYFLSTLSLYFLLHAFTPSTTSAARWYYASTLFLALAVLAKPIVLLFVPAYAIIILWYGYHHEGIIHRKDHSFKLNLKLIKTILGCFILAVLIVSPVLIYNHLLYQEKGITDYYFSVLAGVGDNQIFQGQEAESWSGSRFLSVFKIVLTNIFKFDALLLILGIIGMGIAFRRYKYETFLLVSTLAFLILYLMGKMGSPTHYLWIPLILSIFAGIAAEKGGEKLSTITAKTTPRQAALFLLILVLLNSLLVVSTIIPLKKTSIAINLKEYGEAQIPPDALVILDPRIYRGIFAWAFYDKHYLEGTHFPELLTNAAKLPGKPAKIPVYYIECGPGTYCGWKPEDYARIAPFGEELSTFFHENTRKAGELKAIDTFLLYKGTLTLPPSVYEVIDQTHQHWYTPIGWKYPELGVDTYHPSTTFQKMLHQLGLIILYADVAIALSSLILVFVLLGKRFD